MESETFANLVQTQGNYSGDGGSSKEFARKVVKEEFEKRKRKSGGVYASSSDEEDRNKGRRAKKSKLDEEKEDDEERAKAIQEDLASRYRDRAKERREGQGALEENETEIEDRSEFMIVPHNKKGLNLTQIRKEREKKQVRTSRLDPQADTIRTALPSNKEAMATLLDFVKDATTSSSSIRLSQGMVSYVRGYMKWKTERVVEPSDTISGVSEGRALRNTMFAFAIDGHPSDISRAWQAPRQFTTSPTIDNGSFISSTPMLTNEVIHQIRSIFQKRLQVLNEMKGSCSINDNLGGGKYVSSESTEKTQRKSEYTANALLDDEEDIFGGLDDDVQPKPATLY